MFRIPSNRQEIYDKLSSDTQANLPNTNPQKKQSWLRGILSGFSGAFYDLYFQLKESIKVYFANTTYGEYLEQQCANNGIFRNPATQSFGYISFSGTVGSTIPDGTLLNGISNNIQYETLSTKTITQEQLQVLSITYTSGVATVITNVTHDLVNDINITIAGATPSDLNGTFPVTAIIDGSTLQYDTTLVGSGTATGTITLDVTRAIVDIESTSAGEITNLDTNDQLNLVSAIVGVNNVTRVIYDGLGGGADVENDEDLRARLIYKLQNPVTLFNAVQIELLLKTLSWVDRVFVFRITPDVGQVTIYILKEDNELPNYVELQEAKDLIEDTILPVNTAISDVFILAPTQVIVNFDFSSITPDTPTMRTSITNRLVEFFRNNTDIGEDITEKQYECAIHSTIDIESGELLEDFTLTTPTGDITITTGEIGVLGGVTFP